MRVLNGTAGRGVWLPALAAIMALVALAVLALAPARAGHDGLPPSLTLSLSLLDDADNVVPADSSLSPVFTVTYDNSSSGTPFDLRDVVLSVSGSHEWVQSGSGQLTLDEVVGSPGSPKDVAEFTATGCKRQRIDDRYMQICVVEPVNDPETEVDGTDLSIFIPADTDAGSFTISATGKAYPAGSPDTAAGVTDAAEIHHKALSASLEVTIGEVDEVDEVVEGLSSVVPGYSAWIGSGSVMASELVAALDGISHMLLRQQGRWLRYGVADGRPVPGSYDFEVRFGDVLWLSR